MILADSCAARKVSIAKLGMLRNTKHVGVCVERVRTWEPALGSRQSAQFHSALDDV
jgi:hypothetical protein